MGIDSTFHLLDGRAASHTLTYGTLRAARGLDLDSQLLQFILATDADLVQRLMHSEALLDPDTPEGRRALRLVRLHRALGDVFGTAHGVQAFLDRPRADFGGTPRELLRSVEGIDRVLAWLELHVRDSLV